MHQQRLSRGPFTGNFHLIFIGNIVNLLAFPLPAFRCARGSLVVILRGLVAPMHMQLWTAQGSTQPPAVFSFQSAYIDERDRTNNACAYIVHGTRSRYISMIISPAVNQIPCRPPRS